MSDAENCDCGFEWDVVVDSISPSGQPGVMRLRVPGGWLYIVETHQICHNLGDQEQGESRIWETVYSSPTFVPDPVTNQ